MTLNRQENEIILWCFRLKNFLNLLRLFLLFWELFEVLSIPFRLCKSEIAYFFTNDPTHFYYIFIICIGGSRYTKLMKSDQRAPSTPVGSKIQNPYRGWHIWSGQKHLTRLSEPFVVGILTNDSFLRNRQP